MIGIGEGVAFTTNPKLVGKGKAMLPEGGGDTENKGRSVIEASQIEAKLEAAGIDQYGELVMRLLHRYGVLRSNHLGSLIYGQEVAETTARTKFCRVIAPMEEHGFVVQIALRGEKSAYILGEAGRAWLRLEAGMKKVPADRVSKLGGRHSKLLHDVLIADFMMAIKQDIEQLGGRLAWLGMNDNLDRRNHGQVEWDALGKIELADRPFNFFLEVDRDTEGTGGEFGRKVERYASYYKGGKWKANFEGERFPEILVVTTGGEDKLKNIRIEVARRLKTAGLAGKLVWDFTTFTRLSMAEGNHNPLDANIWGDGSRDFYPIIQYQPVLVSAQRLVSELAAFPSAMPPAFLAARLAEAQALLAKLQARCNN